MFEIEMASLTQAYFELARARYAMGVHSVSPAQFASQLEASAFVCVGDSNSDTPFSLHGEEQGEILRDRRRTSSLARSQGPTMEGEPEFFPSTSRETQCHCRPAMLF